MNRDAGPPGLRLTWLAFSLAALLLAAGLIFLLAAISQPQRLLVSLPLLCCGAGLAAWAGNLWRRARQLSPYILDGRISDLAATQSAEVTLAQVITKLDASEKIARSALSRMEASGLCHQEVRDSRTVYVFPDLKETKAVRQCTYCGSQYPVRDPLHKCANCGGDLEIVKI